MSYKSDPQEFPTRVSHKSIPQECPRRASVKCVIWAYGTCLRSGWWVPSCFSHQKSVKDGVALTTHCKKQFCQGCAKQRKARAVSTLNGSKLEALQKGQHGKLAAPNGGSLWNVAEDFAIRQAHKDSEMTTRRVKLALKQAGLTLRCTNAQLYSYIARSRGQSSVNPNPLQNCLSQNWKQLQRSSWCAIQILELDDVAQLAVLRASVVSEHQVCVVWTCPGMLKRAKAAENKLVKLVIDGKQKILVNECAILTLSFLVSSDKISRAKASRSRSKTTDVYTSTQEPFLQALVNTESAENVSHFFTVATETAKICCKLDLKAQVTQIHKDFSKKS